MQAAVIHQQGQDKVDIRDDITTMDPGPGEVRVRIRATGVCHSDVSVMNGTIPHPVPAVLGHEGAGEVVDVGAGVTNVKEGDRVIVTWVPPCGECQLCLGGQANLCRVITMKTFANPRFLLDGKPIMGFAGTGTWAQEVVMPSQAVVPVGQDVPFDVAALIGCGVMTGVGAVINTAKLVPGSSAVVFGAGGVGISVIQGARVAGAAEIVAVDPLPQKREWALRFGATHAVTPEELPEVMKTIGAGDGFDYAFEVVGRPETIRASYDAARKGGTAVVVGVGRADQKIEFNAYELFSQEKALLGTIYGSSDVRRDFDRVVRLWRAGRLDIEGMISRRLTFDQLNEALETLHGGEVIRQVVEIP